jgi:DNA-binding NarL/FixJ family response regulator
VLAVEQLRCVIVDDNAYFGAVAVNFLGAGGIEVVGVASDCAEALTMVKELRPHVTLVDVNLGGECGFDLADRLDRGPSVVIMMSTCAEEDFSEMISDSRAVGFLTKSELSSSVIRKMVRCAAGSR